MTVEDEDLNDTGWHGALRYVPYLHVISEVC